MRNSELTWFWTTLTKQKLQNFREARIHLVDIMRSTPKVVTVSAHWVPTLEGELQVPFTSKGDS